MKNLKTLLMLIILISLSSEVLAKNSHYHLNPGEPAPEEVWCYSKVPLGYLRKEIEKCEDLKIEMRHLKKLNQELLQSEEDSQPIRGRLKLSAALLVGGLTSYLAQKHTGSAVAGGLLGAFLGTTTVVLLEF